MREVRKKDGSMESVCRHCDGESRCTVCGFVSTSRDDFGVRKVSGHWRVLCTKCIDNAES
jgi:hypothetical protein